MASATTWLEAWSSEAARSQHLVGRKDASDVNRRERCLSLRQRARLVEDDDPDPRQRLERGASLDEEPGLRAARHPGNDGDRDGEDQGAGSGDDQHRQCPQRIAGDEPCPASDSHRDGKEDHREAIGEA